MISFLSTLVRRCILHLYVFIFETLEKFRIYFREDAKTVLGLLDFEMFEKTENGDVVTTSTLRLDPKTESILEIPTSYFTNIQYINDHELQKLSKAIRTQMQGRGMVVLLERLIFEGRTLEILATRKNDDLVPFTSKD